MRNIHATLCFYTATLPADLALTLGKLALAQVPDKLTSVHWADFAVEDDTDATEDSTP